MRGVRGAGDLHVRLGVPQDGGPGEPTNQITASGHVTAVLISYWPAPGHVHGRLHVRELLRARHPGQPRPGPGPHHQQGEQQQGFYNCFSVLLTFRLHNQQNNKRDLAT